ncbi:MarR family winged helix-turn-helix transcriptional regulator [Streptomyces sp. 2-6]|uniref:MarR family winged helix-turn-helix transcriptional regulator n=1 Tax=Streptomyces sp. 2-6 TaxID=2978333 RepID=UPI003D0D9DD8
MQQRTLDTTVAQDVLDEELMCDVEQLVRYVLHTATAGGLSTAASSALARLGREGPQRMTELARAEHASQPNMTQLVTRMERAGLVRRTADATDGRGVLVEITGTGMEVFRRRRAERAQALRRLVEEVSEPERDAVRTALPALAHALRTHRPRP